MITNSYIINDQIIEGDCSVDGMEIHSVKDPKWTFEQAEEIFNLPLMNLLYLAQTIHRENFIPSSVQISMLCNIKTGSCPENCSYCPQSAHYNTGLKKEPLMKLDEVIAAAKIAKAAGSSRFCMGAA
jgi:biotin synthase